MLEALRARRVYATNGVRIFLRTTLDDVHEMGTILPPRKPDAPDSPGVHVLDIRVAAPAPLDRIEVIRSGEIAVRLDGEGETEWSARLEMPALEPGEFVYVRVLQRNDGAAWSSPFFAPPARD